MLMVESDISFKYNPFGYMMLYKGEPIGGAGCLSWGKRRKKGNLEYYKGQAENTKRDILNGSRIYSHMREAIDKIDRRNDDKEKGTESS